MRLIMRVVGGASNQIVLARVRHPLLGGSAPILPLLIPLAHTPIPSAIAAEATALVSYEGCNEATAGYSTVTAVVHCQTQAQL